MNQDSSTWRYSTHPIGNGAPPMWDRKFKPFGSPTAVLAALSQAAPRTEGVIMSRHLIDAAYINDHPGGAPAGTSV